MTRSKLKVILPAVQVLAAIVLLALGSHEVPSVMQDSPPFVPPAVKLCEAINAPAVLAEVGLAVFFQRVHLNPGLSRIISDTCLLGSVALLWFLVAVTVDLHLRTFVTPARVLTDCIAMLLGVALALFAVAASRQEETLLMVGSATWSTALTLASGADLLRCLVLSRKERSP